MGLLRAGRSPDGEQATVRASSSAGRSTRRAPPARGCRDARAGAWWGARQRSIASSVRHRSSTSIGPGGSDRSAPHPVMPTKEFETAELLGWRRSRWPLGLGASTPRHPGPLRREADVPVAELAARRDGDVVTSAAWSARSVAHDPQGRSDGVRPTRRPVRLVGGDRVQLRVRGRPRSVEVDHVLLVKGRVDHRTSRRKWWVRGGGVRGQRPSAGGVRLRRCRTGASGVIHDLAEVARGFPGESAVVVSLETSDGLRMLALGRASVRPEPDFFAEVKPLLGEATVA